MGKVRWRDFYPELSGAEWLSLSAHLQRYFPRLETMSRGLRGVTSLPRQCWKAGDSASACLLPWKLSPWKRWKGNLGPYGCPSQ